MSGPPAAPPSVPQPLLAFDAEELAAVPAAWAAAPEARSRRMSEPPHRRAQRRRRGTGQIRLGREPLLGPARGVSPAAPAESGAHAPSSADARRSPDARVLDVGCGGGLLAEALAREGAQVTAIDLAPGMIEVARLHASEARSRSTTAWRARRSWPGEPPSLRCRHLHGDAGARARTCGDARDARASRCTPGGRAVRLDTEPQPQSFLTGDRRRASTC